MKRIVMLACACAALCFGIWYVRLPPKKIVRHDYLYISNAKPVYVNGFTMPATTPGREDSFAMMDELREYGRWTKGPHLNGRVDTWLFDKRKYCSEWWRIDHEDQVTIGGTFVRKTCSEWILKGKL